jgi:ubiquinone/menaquinone biosynthesis C-methylase UbiE
MAATSGCDGVLHRGEERAVRRYCTYCNGDYAPRCLVMIESLRRHEPDAAIHALCLDATAARIIRDRAPGTHVTTLEELEAFDPALAEAKSNRSAIEFFFTCTPCYPRYLLARYPDTDTVTYLDADVVFFESPARIFAETGDASVAIVPHNFTPVLAARVAYGIYNVSWVMWRNDSEGRRCLEDYRADCLRWCHDRLEPGRYADQKYLDDWPDRYRGVHVIRGKGVNLAVWNADNYELRREGGRVTVDGEPLVLFHGHAIAHVGPGRYELQFGEYGVRRNAAFLQTDLYEPYISRLNELFEALSGVYGLTIRGDVRRRERAAAAAALVSGGYEVSDRETAGVPDPAWLHDDVAAWQDRVYTRILDEARAGRVRVDLAVAAEAVRAAGVATPSLLEIGCGSGYYAEVFRMFLGAEVAYTGLDSSPAMIALARRSHPGAAFTLGDATALPFGDASFDVAFNGASLMHILDFRKAVAESRRVARRACVFHTVPMLARRPTVYLRKRAYGRPTAEVIFNRHELFALFAATGLVVRREWDSVPYDLGPLVGEPTLSRTILCEVAG